MLRKLNLWLLQITLLGGLWLHCGTAWAQDEAAADDPATAIAGEHGKAYVLDPRRATASAQDEAADKGGKSYVLAYVLVGFLVALAMMVVCRGTSRLDKPKMVEADLKHRLEQLQTKQTGDN